MREKEAKSQQDVKNAAKEDEGEQERLHEKISMLDWLWNLNYIINTTNLLVFTNDRNSKINQALKRTRSKVPGRANNSYSSIVFFGTNKPSSWKGRNDVET